MLHERQTVVHEVVVRPGPYRLLLLRGFYGVRLQGDERRAAVLFYGLEVLAGQVRLIRLQLMNAGARTPARRSEDGPRRLRGAAH